MALISGVTHTPLKCRVVKIPPSAAFQATYSLNESISINRRRFNRIPVKKSHFQYFLRLNNRKKFFRHQEIVDAGYASVTIPPFGDLLDLTDIWNWLDDTLPAGSFIYFQGTAYFANKGDAVMFRLTL